MKDDNMKTQSITDDNLELLKQFNKLNRAYDGLATQKTTSFIRIGAPGYYVEFTLTQKRGRLYCEQETKRACGPNRKYVATPYWWYHRNGFRRHRNEHTVIQW